MPWALLFVGVILMVAAVKGNQDDLFELVKDDFTGEQNFFLWVLSIIILVALGNIKSIRPITDAFITLVIIVLVISSRKRNGGNYDIFSDFLRQVSEGTKGGEIKNLQTGEPATLAPSYSSDELLGNLRGIAGPVKTSGQYVKGNSEFNAGLNRALENLLGKR